MIRIAIVFKLFHKDKAGFTLVELIVAITVLSFVLLSLLKAYADVSIHSVAPEYRNTQAMLATELMEDIRSRRFDENAIRDASGNWSTALDIEDGEVAGSSSTFDDVDDFNDFTENLAAPFAGFTRSVTVNYVNGDDLNTAVIIPDPVPDDWTPDFKHVTITLSHSAVEDLQMDTIITNARSDT